MKFDFQYMVELFPVILSYLPIVLYIGGIAFVISLIIGLAMALVINTKFKVLKVIISFVISYLRGVPPLIQIFIFYFGLPQVMPSMSKMDAITAVIIALSIKNGAYLSEVFRSAFNAIDKGQFEACISVNMTKWQSLKTIILPQAMRIAVPSAGNYFILTIKETSLAFTIGVTDMLAKAKLEAAVSYKFLEAFLIVGIIYWIITSLFAYSQSKLEWYLEKPYR